MPLVMSSWKDSRGTTLCNREDGWGRTTSTNRPGTPVDDHPDRSLLLAQISHLENHVLATRKRFAGLFDNYQFDLDEPVVARRFSLQSTSPSSMFRRIPDHLRDIFKDDDILSLVCSEEEDSDDDAIADLTLYGWLSGQGARTILPGPRPELRLPPDWDLSRFAQDAFRRIHPEHKSVAATSAIHRLPLPSAPAGNSPGPAAFATSTLAHGSSSSQLPRAMQIVASSPHLTSVDPSPRILKQAHEPHTPMLAVSSQFESDDRDYETPSPLSSGSDYDSDQISSFDMHFAMSRNLALQHLPDRAALYMQPVVQELKLKFGDSSVTSNRVREVQRSIHTSCAVPESDAAEVDPSTVEALLPAAELSIKSTTRSNANAPSGPNHRRGQSDSAVLREVKFQALSLMRQASLEDMDADRLREVADHMREIGQQRRALATRLTLATC